MCILHKWGKWQQYDLEVPKRTLSSKWQLSGATEHRQKRKCEKCVNRKQFLQVEDEFIYNR